MKNNTTINTQGEEIAVTDGKEQTASVTPESVTNTAQSDTADETGVFIHKFKRPYEYEGKTYEEMTFDFERLTGRDMLAIETEMQNQNEYALAPEISRKFQSRMASKAARIGSDVIDNMPLVEFNKITNAARDFLLNSGY